MSPALLRPALSARLLLEFATERGLPMREALAGLELEPASLMAPDARIDSHAELALIANVVHRLGDRPGLGLELGQRYHLTAYGFWGFALLSSPTLRAALETGLRYLDLSYSYLRVRLRDQDEHTGLIFDADAVPAALRRFLLERDIAALAVILRELFATQVRPSALRFAQPAPADLRPYRRLFGIEPQFNCPETAVLLPKLLLDAPLPQANPLAAQLCENQCRQLLAERRQRGGLAAQVRDRLLRGVGSGQLPDMETLAAELNLSSRSLRRHLDAEGCSYRALIDELRQTLAGELLATPGLKLDEIAARLGYSEAASFLHARKRWRQATPA